MFSNLWEKTSYTAPLDYIINSKIIEYDISKANINVLLYKGLISKKEYEYYYNLPKRRREISIGLLQAKDKKYVRAIIDGIREFRHKFFEANYIEDHNVVSIKNDAIFIANKRITTTKFDNIEFKPKHIYNSFYKLGRIEAYYKWDFYNKEEILDLKNISDQNKALHENYMIDFLKCIFCSAETESISETISIIKDFYDDYVSLKLEPEYYREFNTESKYLFKPFPGIDKIYKAEFIDSKNFKYVDINYNEWLIRQLYRIFIEIYSQQIR